MRYLFRYFSPYNGCSSVSAPSLSPVEYQQHPNKASKRTCEFLNPFSELFQVGLRRRHEAIRMFRLCEECGTGERADGVGIRRGGEDSQWLQGTAQWAHTAVQQRYQRSRHSEYAIVCDARNERYVTKSQMTERAPSQERKSGEAGAESPPRFVGLE